MRNRGTIDLLSDFADYVYEILNYYKYVVCAFIDLSKAFDPNSWTNTRLVGLRVIYLNVV